jgi:peptidoglycan hydrolase-like protein with peptidoglycan-binding domain
MEGPAVDTLQDQLIEFGYMTQAQKNTGAGRFGPNTEKAVKHFQSDNLIDSNGIRDLPTQSLFDQLKAGVRVDSQGGVVLPMQKRLIKTGDLKPEELREEEAKFGRLTEEALQDFQTDNHLDPSGELSAETYRFLYKVRLIETAGPGAIDVILPESGEGFRTFLREPGGATQVGTLEGITALVELARAWNQKHPEVALQYGHISREGGIPFFSTVNPGTLAHETHRNGRTVDVRPIRKDNNMSGTDVREQQYDQARTKELVLLIRERHPGVDIILNDSSFNAAGLTRRFKGHFDHLHVRLPK